MALARRRSGWRCRSSASCSASPWPRSGSPPTPSAPWGCCCSCAAPSVASLAILGLIAITSVLGYLAISVPEGQGLGNLPFLAMMVALTLIAVVAAVFHPIAWTDDEMRFAVMAPAALGALLFFGALALATARRPRDRGARRGHAAARRHRGRARLAGRLRGLPVRGRDRVRAAGRAAGARRPAACPGTACARRRTAGCGPDGSWACRWSGRPSASSSSRSGSTS